MKDYQFVLTDCRRLKPNSSWKTAKQERHPIKAEPETLLPLLLLRFTGATCWFQTEISCVTTKYMKTNQQRLQSILISYCEKNPLNTVSRFN